MVVAAYGLILPPWVLDAAAPRLPQHPRLAAAALARRRADPPRDRGRRRRHRRHHHADGRRPRHRRHAAAPKRLEIGADDTTGALHDRLADARRAADRRGARTAPPAAACSARRSRPTASPTRTRSTKAEAAIDWRARAADDRAPHPRLRPVPRREQRRWTARRDHLLARASSPQAAGEPGEVRRASTTTRSRSPAATGAWR